MEEIELDIDKLISLVSARPVVWDASLEAYKSRSITTEAWRQICSELSPDFETMSDKDKIEFGKLFKQIRFMFVFILSTAKYGCISRYK